MKLLRHACRFLLGFVLLIVGLFSPIANAMPAGVDKAPPSNSATLQIENLWLTACQWFARGTLQIADLIDQVFGTRTPYALGVAAWTKIADLWVPEVLTQGMSEPVVERAAFLDSGVVATSPEVVEAASGPGTSITINHIVSPNHDDQLQVEDTAPEMRKLGKATQVAAIFNRVSPLGATALSGVVSGVKPGGSILSNLTAEIQGLRKRQRNRLVLAALNGLFDTPAAANANTGAFKALRKDSFVEVVGDQTSAHFIDGDLIVDALALAGENVPAFTRGAILMHSVVHAALVKQDQIDTIRDSQGNFVMEAYKGLTVVVSDLLVRNGGTSGKVYTTFICGPGSLAMADKPQLIGGLGSPVIDPASLNIDADVTKNNVAVYDRTRFILHPQGAKWVGEPAAADAGPSNAELADDENWALGKSDVKNVGIVCVRTNG